jgi:hypothetical protein
MQLDPWFHWCSDRRQDAARPSLSSSHTHEEIQLSFTMYPPVPVWNTESPLSCEFVLWIKRDRLTNMLSCFFVLRYFDGTIALLSDYMMHWTLTICQWYCILTSLLSSEIVPLKDLTSGSNNNLPVNLLWCTIACDIKRWFLRHIVDTEMLLWICPCHVLMFLVYSKSLLSEFRQHSGFKQVTGVVGE